jgi:hypothetical protein
MALGRLHNLLIILVISLYLVLNQGFMQLRIPPNVGGGVPIGELALLFSLAITNYFNLLPRLAATVLLTPFLIWWVIGLGRAVAGVPEYGMWALRDATHVIESLFIIVGFVFAARPGAIDGLNRWLPAVLAVVCIYALGVPFAEELQAVSPHVTAGAGYETPVFFEYNSTSGLLLVAAVYLLIFRGRSEVSNIAATVGAALIIGYSVALFQQRTLYLQLLAIIGLFLLFRRDLVRRYLIARWVVVACILTGGLILVSLIGLQIQGRLGVVSFGFLAEHILAIGGVKSSGLEGAAGGVNLRIEWWLDLYERWTASIGNFLFGLGYGFPLTDFVGTRVEEVREPHNSYISILARIGLVGGIAFVWMQVLLLRTWQRTYRMCSQLRWQEGKNMLLIFMVFFSIVLVRALGEPAFEKPFFTIPYYFFWGVVLMMNWRLSAVYRARAANNAAERNLASRKLPPVPDASHQALPNRPHPGGTV